MTGNAHNFHVYLIIYIKMYLSDKHFLKWKKDFLQQDNVYIECYSV